MPARKLRSLVLIFFFTSLLSVVTGSTSLITVPVMIEFGSTRMSASRRI